MDNVEEEIDGLLRPNLGDGSCLNPLGEFVDRYKQVRAAPGHLLEGLDQIQTPDREGPGDGL